ncbi:pleiotropic drug resistance protein 1-like isoform X4 [Vigna unguiculata]|uniref:pleiotropic drug resistance protein 1-like isoform X4 n=1 Tax=Vigna unguiculata TaxID=3917 RepID=UPI00101661BD|nr:pleiotropic drug resistance protein 1-like isoform X4 [Vigna unguiculata]
MDIISLHLIYQAAATGGLEASLVTDYVLKILGLDICADTMMGDEMLCGVSGGQRKRVTTGEMLVGPANALFMDEISTGLDSSTTFQIVKCLKHYVHILDGAVVISLLQPTPETYELFDDIVLISAGQIVYQGPRQHVLEFFESVGFQCPERKGVADFLQEVTSRKDQEQYWMHRGEAYRFVTVTQFVEAFQSFHVGRRIREELAIPFDKSKSHPAALTTRRYGVNKKELLKANISREFLLMKRNSFVHIFKLLQLTTLAILTMIMFLRTEMHRDNLGDGGVYTERSGKANSVVSCSRIENRGMVLPFEPYSITFDQIVYSVDMPQEMKDQGVREDKLVLLKGVSGAFCPGVLTTLMGGTF